MSRNCIFTKISGRSKFTHLHHSNLDSRGQRYLVMTKIIRMHQNHLLMEHFQTSPPQEDSTFAFWLTYWTLEQWRHQKNYLGRGIERKMHWGLQKYENLPKMADILPFSLLTGGVGVEPPRGEGQMPPNATLVPPLLLNIGLKVKFYKCSSCVILLVRITSMHKLD